MARRRINSKKNFSLKGIELIDRVQAYVFIAILLVLPLLIRAKVYYFVAPEISLSALNSRTIVDVFFYYKWIFLALATALSVILLLVKMFVYGYEIRRSYINISLLALTTITLATGFAAEYLSIAFFNGGRFEAALTYCFYFTLLFVAANTNYKKSFSKYTIAAIGIIILLNAIIALCNFFDRNLYGFEFIKSIIFGSVTDQFPKGSLTTTLSNRNYLSGLSGAATLFFVTFALLRNSLKARLVCGLLSVISFATLLAALSSSGFLSALVVLPVIAVLTMIRNKDRFKTIGAAGLLFVAFCLVFWGMNSYNGHVWKEAFGPMSAASSIFDSVSTGEDLDETSIETTGSGRTYIWKKTIELIKERPVLGYGHDTLSYYFPQNDPEKFFGARTIVDKPHNMYLETVYGSGIFALVALFALLLLHFYNTLKILLRGMGDREMVFPAALFVFWCAFLLQWLFNDSIIGSAPLFWVLFGVSVSLNAAYEEQKKELA